MSGKLIYSRLEYFSVRDHLMFPKLIPFYKAELLIPDDEDTLAIRPLRRKFRRAADAMAYGQRFEARARRLFSFTSGGG